MSARAISSAPSHIHYPLPRHVHTTRIPCCPTSRLLCSRNQKRHQKIPTPKAAKYSVVKGNAKILYRTKFPTPFPVSIFCSSPGSQAAAVVVQSHVIRWAICAPTSPQFRENRAFPQSGLSSTLSPRVEKLGQRQPSCQHPPHAALRCSF